METNLKETEKREGLLWFGVHNGKVEPGLNNTIKEKEGYEKRLDLLYNAGKKVSSASEMWVLLNQTLHMVQQTLQASASSVLLIDQGRKELYFQVAEGKAKNTIRQVRLSLDSGIAGWVVRHVRPLIVNDVTRDKRFNKEIDKLTGFVTNSVLAVPLVFGHKVIGVLEVLNKVDGSAFNEQDLEVSIALTSTAAVAISNARLHQVMLDGYKSTVKALAAAIDAKDPYTSGHSRRVMEYAVVGANSLRFSPEELQAIEFAGMLHDVGKIGVDDAILRKSGLLAPEEWLIVQKHPMIGANIIREIPFLEGARDLVLHHHERYDGMGYPEGLKGEDIPLGARLLAVADAFDTMTTERSYRRAQSFNDALYELGKCAGAQFCPVAVEAFVSGFKEQQRMLAQFSSGVLVKSKSGGGTQD